MQLCRFIYLPLHPSLTHSYPCMLLPLYYKGYNTMLEYLLYTVMYFNNTWKRKKYFIYPHISHQSSFLFLNLCFHLVLFAFYLNLFSIFILQISYCIWKSLDWQFEEESFFFQCFKGVVSCLGFPLFLMRSLW